MHPYTPGTRSGAYAAIRANRTHRTRTAQRAEAATMMCVRILIIIICSNLNAPAPARIVIAERNGMRVFAEVVCVIMCALFVWWWWLAVLRSAESRRYLVKRLCKSSGHAWAQHVVKMWCI